MELDEGNAEFMARAASAVPGIAGIALALVTPLLSHCSETFEQFRSRLLLTSALFRSLHTF